MYFFQTISLKPMCKIDIRKSKYRVMGNCSTHYWNQHKSYSRCECSMNILYYLGGNTYQYMLYIYNYLIHKIKENYPQYTKSIDQLIWNRFPTNSSTYRGHAINTLRPRQMDAISQTTFSNAFSWMKMFEFRLKFHWSLFPRVELTILQHWFR